VAGVAAPRGVQPSAWTVPCGRTAGEPIARLLCFPYAGAGASVFRSWRLPPAMRTDVWAVQAPGRENRRAESPNLSLDALVTACVQHLSPLLDRPFALFGHSLGALVAFEFARSLRRAGGPQPTHLFVSSFRAPHLPRSREPVSALRGERFLERMYDMIGPSRMVLRDPELMLAAAPLVRAECAMGEHYEFRPEPPLVVPVTSFTAIDDNEVDVDEAAAWRKHTDQRFDMRTFSGGHLYVRDRANLVIAEIGRAMTRTLLEPE
jgi:medium-chain acyl-[acyl-carrier-protein] hydrolase